MVVKYMALNQSIEILGKYVRLTYVLNPGAAFGISVGNKSIFLAISIVAVIVIIIYYFHLHHKGTAMIFFLGCILGGALGNLADRIRVGEVVDFMDIGAWPVFNVADIGVTVGVLGLIYLIFMEEREQKRKAIENDNRTDIDTESDGRSPESVRTIL
jgi:signal peptidase II